MMRDHRRIGTVLLAMALAGGAMLLGGCRGDTSDAPPRRFFPDMDYQPKYMPQAESRFFRDYVVPEGEVDAGRQYGRTAREPVAGTVPFGKHPVVDRITVMTDGVAEVMDPADERRWLAMNEPRVFTGREADGSYVERIPIPVTDELMALGKKNWDIYCIVCHGGTGVGGNDAGMVGLRWQYAIPNLHSDQYKPGAGGEEAMEGYQFHIIRNGLRNTGPGLEYRMPPYGHNIDTEEAWAVVAYLRALQLARRANPDLLGPQERLRLEQQRALGPASPGTSSTAAATSSDEKQGKPGWTPCPHLVNLSLHRRISRCSGASPAGCALG